MKGKRDFEYNRARRQQRTDTSGSWFLDAQRFEAVPGNGRAKVEERGEDKDVQERKRVCSKKGCDRRIAGILLAGGVPMGCCAVEEEKGEDREWGALAIAIGGSVRMVMW